MNVRELKLISRYRWFKVIQFVALTRVEITKSLSASPPDDSGKWQVYGSKGIKEIYKLQQSEEVIILLK